MRLAIEAVGRLKAGPMRELFQTYCDRFDALGRAIHIGPVASREIRESKARNAEARRTEEAAALLEKRPNPPYLIVLDEAGDALTSRDFAKLLGKRRDSGDVELVFIVGGADGVAKSLADKANFRLALGPMTLSHGLARVVLAEQLYRAATILAGHPYHRD